MSPKGCWEMGLPTAHCASAGWGQAHQLLLPVSTLCDVDAVPWHKVQRAPRSLTAKLMPPQTGKACCCRYQRWWHSSSCSCIPSCQHVQRCCPAHQEVIWDTGAGSHLLVTRIHVNSFLQDNQIPDLRERGRKTYSLGIWSVPRMVLAAFTSISLLFIT